MKYSARILTVLVWMFLVSSSVSYAAGKILYVDSYHEGYAWSDSITEGIRSALAGTDAELRIFRMDTKRNTSKNFMRKAAIDAKMLIEQYQPDVVIASDDNASMHLVKPFYRETDLPVVFCGVNWDASMYGFPCKNITGMVEVAPFPRLLEYLTPLASGDRIAYLAADVTSGRKDGRYYREIFGIEMDEFYARTLQEWSSHYTAIQADYDFLIVGNSAGVKDWDADEVERIVLTTTKIPSGTVNNHMTPFALVGCIKLGEEQGQWAAETALSILRGTDVGTIPITTNKDGALCIHKGILKTLHLSLPTEMLEEADTLIEE